MLVPSLASAQDVPIAAEPVPDADAASPLEGDAAFRFRRFVIAHDNDGWLLDRFNPEDRAYTGGGQLLFGFDGRWADWVGERLPFAESFGDAEFALAAGLKLQVFTPDDVRDVEDPDPDERPYAGYLTSTFAAQRRKANTEDHFQLDLGVIGPSSLAEEAQTALHTSRGWDKQLPDEFAVNARLRKTWRVPITGELHDGFAMELLPDLSGDVGNVYIRGSLGLTLRAGLNLPDDFQTPRIDDPGSMLGGWTSPGIYAFVRGQTQLVAYNAFLDGTAFHDSRSVDSEPFVNSVEIGGVWNLGSYFGWRDAELIYSWTALTDEYDNDDLFDSYGTLQLRIGF